MKKINCGKNMEHKIKRCIMEKNFQNLKICSINTNPKIYFGKGILKVFFIRILLSFKVIFIILLENWVQVQIDMVLKEFAIYVYTENCKMVGFAKTKRIKNPNTKTPLKLVG